MREKADWLNGKRFKSLRYNSSNGTDFTVQLIPGAKWCGAADINRVNGAAYVPNMPTEEVFISPMKASARADLLPRSL